MDNYEAIYELPKHSKIFIVALNLAYIVLYTLVFIPFTDSHKDLHCFRLLDHYILLYNCLVSYIKYNP